MIGLRQYVGGKQSAGNKVARFQNELGITVPGPGSVVGVVGHVRDACANLLCRSHRSRSYTMVSLPGALAQLRYAASMLLKKPSCIHGTVPEFV